jgi:hypothetical protein
MFEIIDIQEADSLVVPCLHASQAAHQFSQVSAEPFDVNIQLKTCIANEEPEIVVHIHPKKIR